MDIQDFLEAQLELQIGPGEANIEGEIEEAKRIEEKKEVEAEFKTKPKIEVEKYKIELAKLHLAKSEAQDVPTPQT